MRRMPHRDDRRNRELFRTVETNLQGKVKASRLRYFLAAGKGLGTSAKS